MCERGGGARLPVRDSEAGAARAGEGRGVLAPAPRVGGTKGGGHRGVRAEGGGASPFGTANSDRVAESAARPAAGGPDWH